MGVSLKITMPDLSGLAGGVGETPQKVLEGWGQDANTLLELEKYHVTQRTLERAYDTGALASSVTGQAYENAKNGTIIAVWFNNAQQYAQWHRYYAPYQEGPPIGVSTYTNPPRHMLYDSKQDDAGDITKWAVEAGGAAIDDWVSGLGLPEE